MSQEQSAVIVEPTIEASPTVISSQTVEQTIQQPANERTTAEPKPFDLLENDLSIFKNLWENAKKSPNFQNEVNFIVVHHGLHADHGEMNGFYNNIQKFIKTFPDAAEYFFCHNCKSNEGNKTLIGADNCGCRAALEIIQVWKQNVLKMAKNEETVFRFGIVGQSFGGLVIRQAILLLFSESELAQSERVYAIDTFGKPEFSDITLQDFVDFRKRSKPHLFMTTCTPHMGITKPGGSLYKSLKKFVYHAGCNNFNGKSGLQLTCSDSEKKYNFQPFLRKMTEPQYLDVLKTFPHRILLGNAHHDILVPFCSALIRTYNPYSPVPYVKYEKIEPLKPKFIVNGFYGFFSQTSKDIEEKPENLETQKLKEDVLRIIIDFQQQQQKEIQILFEEDKHWLNPKQNSEPIDFIKFNEKKEKEDLKTQENAPSNEGSDKSEKIEKIEKIEEKSETISPVKTEYIIDNRKDIALDKIAIENWQKSGITFKRIDDNHKFGLFHIPQAHSFQLGFAATPTVNYEILDKEAKKCHYFAFDALLAEILS